MDSWDHNTSITSPHTDLDGSGQSVESITNHPWSFFKEIYFHMCVAGLTEVPTGHHSWLSSRWSVNLSLPETEKVDPFTLSHKLPLFHFSKLTSALIQPLCECVSFEDFKSGLMPGWAGLHVWLQILLLTDICKQMHEAPTRRRFFFFDQSSFNKSSWLDANVTFCMWKDEAGEGLVSIRPKLINGGFKQPPCYCGETPEVQGFKSRLISTLLLLFLLQTNE